MSTDVDNTLETFDGFADYVAGKRAVLSRVGLTVSGAGLVVHLPEGRQEIWPWDDLRALKDQADRDGLVIYRSEAQLARLFVADATLADAIKTRATTLARRTRPVPLAKLAGWATAAVASVAVIIFALVPLMASQLAEFLPAEGEKALGDATLEQIRVALDETGLGGGVSTCYTPDGRAALDEMYARIAPEIDLPYPVEVHVFDHELVNAFALPGGHVVLFRGLIDTAQTPDEVAAVLAHEIGHVVHRDPTRDALRSAGSLGVLGLLFGDFAGGTVALMLANQLVNASYSQAAETRADEFAHGVLEAANVTPSALGSFFQRMQDENGDVEGFAAHLSSHPQFAKRIAASASAAHSGRDYNPVLSRGQWRDLRRICGEPATIGTGDIDADDEGDATESAPVDNPRRTRPERPARSQEVKTK